LSEDEAVRKEEWRVREGERDEERSRKVYSKQTQ
jgi:hypothetical protein